MESPAAQSQFFMVDRYIDFARERLDIDEHLPASLIELSLVNVGSFLHDLARILPARCPRLVSLHLNIGYADHMVPTLDVGLGNSLVDLLGALPGLVSLSLKDLWLYPNVLRAIGDLANLRKLKLHNVKAAGPGVEVALRPVGSGNTADTVALRARHPSKIGNRFRQLRQLALTDNFGGGLPLLLRAISSAPRLTFLTVHLTYLSDELISALATCWSSSPLESLFISSDRRVCRAAQLEGLVRAVLGARRTLRSLSISSLRSERATDGAICGGGIFAHLIKLTELRRLTLTDVFGDLGAISNDRSLNRLDCLLFMLVTTVATAAPGLQQIDVNFGAHSHTLPEKRTLVTRLPLTGPQVERVERQRKVEGGGSAWGVVSAGIAAAQERRIAAAQERRIAAPQEKRGIAASEKMATTAAGSSLHRAYSIVELVPASVLRNIGSFLRLGVALKLM